MAEIEGVIKYELQHEPGSIGAPKGLRVLRVWRAILHRLGLVGQDPARYGGLGYGNVSCRESHGFLISGTQTGAPERLGDDGWVHVLDATPMANRIRSRGPVRPSSEALTHAACYAADARIQCVLHVHSPEIWAASSRLGLAETPASIPYGTPAMAGAVAYLHARKGLEGRGLIVMLGHGDGVLALGRNVADAGMQLVETLARALDDGSVE